MRFFLALALAGAFAFQAHAQETQTGRGLACDTKEQVETFVKSMQSGASANDALKAANAGQAKSCGVVMIAYREDKQHGSVEIGGRTYLVIEFTVIGFNNGNDWAQVKPTTQYGLKATMDRGA